MIGNERKSIEKQWNFPYPLRVFIYYGASIPDARLIWIARDSGKIEAVVGASLYAPLPISTDEISMSVLMAGALWVFFHLCVQLISIQWNAIYKHHGLLATANKTEDTRNEFKNKSHTLFIQMLSLPSTVGPLSSSDLPPSRGVNWVLALFVWVVHDKWILCVFVSNLNLKWNKKMSTSFTTSRNRPHLWLGLLSIRMICTFSFLPFQHTLKNQWKNLKRNKNYAEIRSKKSTIWNRSSKQKVGIKEEIWLWSF